MADDAREYEKVAQTAFRSGAKPPKHPVGKSTVKRMITNAGWAGVIFIGLFAWTAFGLAIAAYVKEQAISVPSLSNVVNITIAGQSVKFCYPNSTNIQTVINNVNLNIIQGGDIYLCPGVFTGPLLIKQPGINLYGAAEGGTVLWEASVTIDLSNFTYTNGSINNTISNLEIFYQGAALATFGIINVLQAKNGTMANHEVYISDVTMYMASTNVSSSYLNALIPTSSPSSVGFIELKRVTTKTTSPPVGTFINSIQYRVRVEDSIVACAQVFLYTSTDGPTELYPHFDIAIVNSFFQYVNVIVGCIHNSYALITGSSFFYNAVLPSAAPSGVALNHSTIFVASTSFDIPYNVSGCTSCPAFTDGSLPKLFYSTVGSVISVVNTGGLFVVPGSLPTIQTTGGTYAVTLVNSAISTV